MYQPKMLYKSNRANAYLAKEILEASPQKLLLKVYDFAIVNCKNQNVSKTNKALNELISALRFDTDEAKEISTGLLRLYRFCQDQMKKGDFDIVVRILSDLKEAWITIFEREND